MTNLGAIVAGVPAAADNTAARRAYLSGVISLGGTLNDAEIRANTRRFKLAAEALRSWGYEVVDPTALRPPVAMPTWQDWMRTDIAALISCEVIVMLDGWEASKGARLERHIAGELGMNIITYSAVSV